MNKKLFSVVALACIFATAAWAQSFNRVKVVLSAGAQNDYVYFIESADFNNTFENGYDEVKILNTMGMNIYAIVANGSQSKVYTNDIKGIPVGVKAKSSVTNYSISFAELQGSGYYFVDYQTDSVFEITSTAKYDVVISETEAVDDRFAIYLPFAGDAGELDICFQYGKLLINNNPYTDNIVVKDEAGQVVLEKMARTTPQVISLSSLAAGHYTVSFGNGAKEMLIRVQ